MLSTVAVMCRNYLRCFPASPELELFSLPVLLSEAPIGPYRVRVFDCL